MLLFVVLSILGFAAYHFVDSEFMVAKEVPYYRVGPRPDDDTIRVAVIGDSWAQFHKSFKCDALFEQYARKWTPNKSFDVQKPYPGELMAGWLLYSTSYRRAS